MFSKSMGAIPLSLCLAFAPMAQARPISYPGGWTIMQMTDSSMHALHVAYSPSWRYSLGYRGEYWREEEAQFHGVELANLVKRWNMPESQANFYIESAVGAAYSDYRDFDAKTEPAAFTGISLDWEDRRFFTKYENRLTYAGDIQKSFTQKARVGIAPYIGDYGDIHTWLMLEVEHNPSREEETTVTPLVRLFKGTYLAEAGINNNGDILFNFTLQY